MNRFAYAAPTTREEAVLLLEGDPGEALPLAGGTDLLSLLKDFIVRPSRVVSLQAIPGLAGVEETEGRLRLGAMTRLSALMSDALAKARLPALLEAAAGVRSVQMRAMGTLGGDLLQRPRCWYFRRGFGLLAWKDGKSMVEHGDHRDHAVFDNQGKAKWVNPSSFAPVLIALGANAVAFGPKGERRFPLAELYRLPEAEGESEFSLAHDELLLAVEVPAAPRAQALHEVRHRQGLDWPQAAAAVALELDGDVVRSASAVLGHVAPRPRPVAAAALAPLAGKRKAEVDEALAESVAAAAVAEATPLRGNAHKVQLAKVALRRALLSAAGNGSGS